MDYSQLLQFSLRTAHESLRRAVASIAGISPLRVVDVHVSKKIFLEIQKKEILVVLPIYYAYICTNVFQIEHNRSFLWAFFVLDLESSLRGYIVPPRGLYDTYDLF